VRDRLDRRAFLRRGVVGAGGVALLGPSLLAACGDDDDTSTSGGGGGGSNADFGTLDYQFSWIKNVEFAGQYIADTEGYYQDAGFSSVNLKAGGPNVQQDSVVASKKAFLGISAPDITGSAILKGADLIAVGALFQKNPFAIMSLAGNPIPDPEAMKGKKIGVQAVNEPVWNAFLKANKIDPAKIEKVPVQFDPQPLTTGEVDGWFSFFTNEPNLLKMKGIPTVNFLLDDHNYPLVSQIYVVRTDSVAKSRDKIKALLQADIKGWLDSIKDPAAGAKLTVEKYGKDLDLTEEEQVLESVDQNTLIVTEDTKQNGIMTVTDELVEESIATLALADLQIDAKKLFDLSIINEIYQEDPDLKKLPA
jgi:ABC-type nitrate/sulfonate/bicarbonate transport system substrate-binding protein